MNNHYFWPLVCALPDLLSGLIEKESCQSLERLQLLSLEIEHNQKPLDAAYFAQKQVLEEGQMLVLSGVLMADKTEAAKVKINYFMRGARKFFLVKPVEIDGEARLLKAIDFADVEQFFLAQGQDPSFFTNKELSELNGIVKPLVPSLMIIDLMLKEAHKEYPLAQKFILEFKKGVKITEALSIIKDDQGLTLLAFDEQALTLRVLS